MINKHKNIEPGLLKLFRWFASFDFFVAGISLFGRWLWGIQPVNLLELTRLGWLVLLLLYLFSEEFRQKLGGWYLPLAIAFATLSPMFIYWFEFIGVLPALNLTGGIIGRSWLLFIELLTPVIMLSWQYEFRYVVIYSLLVTLLAIGVSMPYQSLDVEVQYYYVIEIVAQMIVFLLIGYAQTRLVQAQREQRESLKKANLELARFAETNQQLAVSRERNRLARELHDTLAHSLSAIAVQLQAAGTVMDNEPEKAKGLLEDMLFATRKGLSDTRRAIQALRSAPLEDLGLILAIRTLSESAAQRMGLELSLDLPVELPALSTDLEQAIYRIVEEAITNVGRHAQARRLMVSIALVGKSLKISVEDDGKGFQIEDVIMNERSFGLRGMRERAYLVGGEIQVISKEAVGTRIDFTVKEAV
jgi:signal transduction histidine kinase